MGRGPVLSEVWSFEAVRWCVFHRFSWRSDMFNKRNRKPTFATKSNLETPGTNPHNLVCIWIHLLPDWQANVFSGNVASKFVPAFVNRERADYPRCFCHAVLVMKMNDCKILLNAIYVLCFCVYPLSWRLLHSNLIHQSIRLAIVFGICVFAVCMYSIHHWLFIYYVHLLHLLLYATVFVCYLLCLHILSISCVCPYILPSIGLLAIPTRLSLKSLMLRWVLGYPLQPIIIYVPGSGSPPHPPCHPCGMGGPWEGVGVIQPPTSSNVTGRIRWRKLISGKTSMCADISYKDVS